MLLNYDIHGKDDIEQELEEDNEKILILLTLLYLNNQKNTNRIIICKYLIVSETLQKNAKGLHSNLAYRIFKNERKTG